MRYRENPLLAVVGNPGPPSPRRRYRTNGGGEKAHTISSHLTRPLTEADYPGVFQDRDQDLIPDVDDPFPLVPGRQTVEEVRLSDEVRELFRVRDDYEGVRQQLESQLRAWAGPSAQVLSRTKTPFSILNKLRRKRLVGKKGITDVVGAMLVVQDRAELERVVDAIKRGAFGKVVEVEDFYAEPREGYRAYHFVLSFGPGDHYLVELQVKTARMKAIAGAAHTVYKRGTLDGGAMAELTELADAADRGDAQAAADVDFFLSDPAQTEALLTKRARRNPPPSGTAAWLERVGKQAGRYDYDSKAAEYATWRVQQLRWAYTDALQALHTATDSRRRRWYTDDAHTIAAELRRRGAWQENPPVYQTNGPTYDRPGYPFAYYAEKYAGYDDAALHWALRDAASARDNARGWNDTAESWYADDVHTIRAEMNRRGFAIPGNTPERREADARNFSAYLQRLKAERAADEAQRIAYAAPGAERFKGLELDAGARSASAVSGHGERFRGLELTNPSGCRCAENPCPHSSVAGGKAPATVGRNRSGKPPEKKGRPPKVTYMTLSEARQRPELATQLAEKRFDRFHDADPSTKVAIYHLPDGKSDTTWANMHVALGIVPETRYSVPWQSNKAGALWKHPHPEGEEPLEVLDPLTDTTKKILRGTVIDDWWHS